MPSPRFSREDLAKACAEMAHEATVGLGGNDRRCALVSTDRLRLWAAMVSEAAHRAPTHAELMAGAAPKEERRVNAAERLCLIYFAIAAEALGEDEVRRRVHAEVERITGGVRA